MLKLFAVFVAAVILAYISERHTKLVLASGRNYSVRKDWAYIALIVILTLFAGLRTQYNDTWNYIRGFNNAVGVHEWLSDPENLNPFRYPLFYFFQSLLKSVFGNAQILIFLSSLVTQCCFIRFFKRYSEHFVFSIFLYFTLGTLVFSLAALKQVLSMAVVTLAVPLLEEKKWIQYLVVILFAMLIHTYSIVFILLPLCRARPWKSFTFIFLGIIALILLNFREVITAFLDQANELGKTIAEYEVFDNNTINLLRLAVYAVTPIMCFVLQRWIFVENSKIDNVLAHMSIISFAFMCLGTQSGANMFARMAMYFELGTICYLPKILKKAFSKESCRYISLIAVVCFVGFFLYANCINMNFGDQYRSMSFFDFVLSIL